ncbi:DNA-binding response OmpR family regulator [Malaciobacter marinus]|jgi:DNA-binding response OmpR family regulator|uniref:DNA-binding response OmpR family regulator n=1 Tax=Malaciobacter marinus TaxID=505249 RepID=A0AB36ZYL9_9BACT|nr:response regulator transcription factor [Malaciobacter marinus]PPK61170.1 DNA-binding response OmpR family regulator [Malaciobacter marinus]SKB35535.1 DNA-binding response regulator, OmpR family, contains REC and winged-helix (wHTH) domain [Malaciobacter marinus]
MKILLLEDDYNYNESITEYLEDLGFQVDSFYDGEEALDAIVENSYYLLILDIKVPKLNGHELIKYLNEMGNETPILIMTSLVDIDNMTIGYELGCDDYLKKPFELKELELRVTQLIKSKYNTDKNSTYKLKDGYTFEFISGVLKKDDIEIELTSKEIELIRFLIKNANYYCEIENLRENVWEGKDIHYADIRMYISKIRVKTNKEFILSSRGLGYKIEIPS